MKCNKVIILMSDYIDDCLPDPVRCEFERHIKECKSCETELDAMEQIVSNLTLLSGHKSLVDCWAVVHQRITETDSRSVVIRHWFLRPIVAAPALAAMLVFCYFMIWPIIVPAPEMTPKTITAPGGLVSQREYGQYIGAHSQLQRHQAFSDPDVAFINAELETASLTRD